MKSKQETLQAKVVLDLSISLDGYIARPDDKLGVRTVSCCTVGYLKGRV
jgi:hypothetical protein